MICIYACLSTRSEIRCEVAGIAYSVNQGRAESSSGAGARGKKMGTLLFYIFATSHLRSSSLHLFDLH